MAGPWGAASMNDFIELSESHEVQVQKALRRSFNNFTARFPWALRACPPMRKAANRNAGRKRKDRTRKRVTETKGMEHLKNAEPTCQRCATGVPRGGTPITL